MWERSVWLECVHDRSGVPIRWGLLRVVHLSAGRKRDDDNVLCKPIRQLPERERLLRRDELCRRHLCLSARRARMRLRRGVLRRLDVREQRVQLGWFVSVVGRPDVQRQRRRLLQRGGGRQLPGDRIGSDSQLLRRAE